MAKTVIVSCGTGIATSTVAAKAIEEACKQAGIPVTTKQCKGQEIPELLRQGADLIVTTSTLRFDPGIPVVKGLAFLTGIGVDQVVEEILDHLRD
ncbi:MAG: PTS sugar transporter subunit IIB [Anaerolineales bacterium]|jgi:PTS system galactitol-specific IIB component